MPAIVTSIVTIAQAAFTWMSANTIAAFAVRTALTFGVSKLIANRAAKNASGSQASGARIQAAPSTLNKLPVVYGTAYMGGKIIDAKISIDQKKMWYVMALSEVTSTMPGETPDTFTFGDIYFNGKKCIFGDGTNTSKVTAVETNSDPVQQDDRISGKAYIWRFPNGSSSGIDTGGSSAITLLSDAEIPADLQWDSALYTTGGQSASMNNTCFVVVKIEYNDDVGTVGVPEVVVELTNSRTKPGDVIYDYLYNSVYGCGIPLANIDTASLTALNTYSDETITYVPVGGGSASQVRYRINGPIDTGQNCLSNLQDLCDSCDSWLQYSELNAKWKVVINKPYSGVLGDLYNVNSDVLVGGIDVNPIDLNETYNGLEVQYPDANIRDQVNTKFINLIDFAPEVMSPNEAINTLVIQYPLVNNYVQTVYLGLRRLLQGREDLTINFRLDYSGIQLEAGDVVRVNLAEYGWTDKLFRVSQVQETKDESGNLFANIIAFEYNGSIYADNAIQDYVPADNTGLTDPNIIGTPDAPIATLDVATSIAQMYIQATVPTIGSVSYMDFNVGNSSNSATHTFYTSVNQANGAPYAANANVSINVTDLVADTYYWSVTARNKQAGTRSASSNSIVWTGGPTVTPTTTVSFCNASSSGTLVTHDALDLVVGTGLIVTSGTGLLAANTYIANIVSNTQFNLNSTPLTALSNACLAGWYGGIPPNSVQPGVGGYAVVTSYDVANGGIVQVPVAATSTSTRNIPLIYPGADPGASYVFPYQQGTSTTANGYSSNSTSAWNPAGAALLYASNSSASISGWYKLIDVNLTAVPWDDDEFIISQATFNMYSDTDSTVFQIAPFARFSNDPGNNVIQTQYLSTFISYQDPITSVASVTYNNQATGNVAGVGIYIRNITANTNLTVYSGTYSVQQKLIGPGSIV